MMRPPVAVAGALGLILGIAALFVWLRFDRDIKQARARVAHGRLLIETRCGPVEYQEAGTGVPLLAVHGSGGGYDQGMAFAGPQSWVAPQARHRRCRWLSAIPVG
jgi:hypothetical protein